MFLVLKTGEIPGFAESVHLHKLDVGQKLSSSADQFRRHGRSAISQHLETAQIVLLRPGKLRQQVDHRRHQYSVVDLMRLDRLTESGRREAWKRDLAPAEC